MSQTVLNELQRIAKVASENKDFQFRNLATRLTEELLHLAYQKVRKDGATGVDKVTAQEYAHDLNANISNLHRKLKEQKYKAPKIRRTWIPKENGGSRPLGIPTFEDKVAQKAVSILLESIYEQDFYDFSYGYRPGKRLQETLEPIRKQCMQNGIKHIIDADIEGYFENLDHHQLKEFLKQRVVDGRIRNLIGRWLRAGVQDGDKVDYPKAGTPQGGVISPLLANIYLHYVLDEWFVEQVKPRMKGKVFIVRVADDFIIGCELKEDAQRIMEVLPKRMAKYGLTINEAKTKLADFSKPSGNAKKGKVTFDFIGFRLYWGKSRNGKWIVKVKTSPKRVTRILKHIRVWCKTHRHEPVKQQHVALRTKLLGHYNYYGVSFNLPSLSTVCREAERCWFTWLNRRGGKRRNWEQWRRTIGANLPLPRPRIRYSFFQQPPGQLSFT